MASDGTDSRRGFLKVATAALGGLIGASLGLPILRYVLHPVGRKTVSSTDAPIDVAAASEVVAGAPPMKVELRADEVRDGWTRSEGVAIGSAWVSRDGSGELRAFTSACPHLGCAVHWNEDAEYFQCPCHRSAFSRTGEKLEGPAKRGLDPLPVKEENGRIKLTFVRYRPDVPERAPV